MGDKIIGAVIYLGVYNIQVCVPGGNPGDSAQKETVGQLQVVGLMND